MAKTAQVNLRVSEEDRAALERAASLEGQSVSAFVAHAARRHAARVLNEHSSMVVADDVFDWLLATLDDAPEPLAPPLAKALEQLPGSVERR